MDLISCDGCGVVLDKHKLKFPKGIEYVEGSVDMAKCAWNGNDYVPFVNCSICCKKVLESA